MPILNLNEHGRTYDYIITYSPIYECALDIAAFTWPQIHGQLERTPETLHGIRKALSPTLYQEVELAGQVNTWRSLLFLAHRCPMLRNLPPHEHVEAFCRWMEQSQNQLIRLALPYIDSQSEADLARAADGDNACQQKLVTDHEENPLLRPHLAYLFETHPKAVCAHLVALLHGWYKDVIANPRELLHTLMEDCKEKTALCGTLPAREFIQSVKRGEEFSPSPDIREIWLIPQIAYRPFTIMNDLPNACVFYYPLADHLMVGDIDDVQAIPIAAVHKAIGDAHRLHMLKLLRTSARTVTEFATILGLAKSTVHHHLTLLRTAGLVKVDRSIYTIHLERIAQYTQELRRFLNMEDDEP